MAELINSSSRQLIPRWHTSRKMNLMNSCPKNIEMKLDDGLESFRIEQKRRHWVREPSVQSATDLFVALRLADMTSSELFKEIESYLLLKKEKLGNTAIDLLSPRLKRIDSSNNYATDKASIYAILRTLKGIVKECPYDALTWNDLAFYYTVIGEKNKAMHCMSIAHGLNPNHTLLARSYSRLLVHYDDPEKALWILKKTGHSKSNPEILSADIAIRVSCDVGQPDVLTARRLINKYENIPHVVSELAASVGTLEVKSGSLKKGKQHLVISAVAPTENTIAQLKWMSQKHKIIIPVNDSLVRSIEADAIVHYNQKKYDLCRKSLMRLHEFQPFSDGALVDAGYISFVALDDPEFVMGFSEAFNVQLVGGFSAKNNYIVACIETNNMSEVDVMLQDLYSLAKEDKDKAVLMATIGMYLYRIGDYKGGREQYKNAQAFFKAIKNSFANALSLIHQGVIEKKVGLGSAKFTLEEAKKEAKKLSHVPELMDKINRELKGIVEK